MQRPELLNEQEASRLIGISRSELKRHTQQRTFGLRPKFCTRNECFYDPNILRDFQRNLTAQKAAESLFGSS
ncbi:hypothetical protein JCM19379_28200 [Methyloparacoccus murrellii]